MRQNVAKAEGCFLMLSLILLLSACTLSSPRCGREYPSDDSRYCEIPRIATNFYREHLWYSAYTYPETYFSRLPEKPQSDTINILALGDSWFAYPKSNWAYFDIITSPSNVLTNLASLKHPSSNILSLSNAGEIVTNIAGLAIHDALEQAQSIQQEHSIPWAAMRALRRMKETKGKNFDYVLISGGGNDFYPSRIKNIFGNVPCEHPSNAMKCLKTAEVTKLIDRLQLAYRTLIDSIHADQEFKDIRIITHTYDEIYPMPIGARLVYGLIEKGDYGWFYPVLEELQITDPTQQRIITSYLLKSFQDMLLALEGDPKYKGTLIVVKTQGVIQQAYEWDRFHEVKDLKEIPTKFREDYWLNEIHPTSRGFRCISETIHQHIRDDLRVHHVPFEEEVKDTYTCFKYAK